VVQIYNTCLSIAMSYASFEQLYAYLYQSSEAFVTRRAQVSNYAPAKRVMTRRAEVSNYALAKRVIRP
jgi:hypothetical protein